MITVRAGLPRYLTFAVGIVAAAVFVIGAVLFHRGAQELGRAGPDPTVSDAEGYALGYNGLAGAYLHQVQQWASAGGLQGQADKKDGQVLMIGGGAWVAAAGLYLCYPRRQTP